MRTVRLPTSRCPDCRYEMDMATCIEEGGIEPKPGDVSCCINCGALLEFNDILVAKRMTQEAFKQLDPYQQAAFLAAVEEIKKRGKFA